MNANLDNEELSIFLIEAYEKLDLLDSNLILLENHLKFTKFSTRSPEIQELLNTIFRDLHTIKGNSGFLALNDLEAVCHAGESLLDRIRGGYLVPNQEIISTLLRGVDVIRGHLQSLENGESASIEDLHAVLNQLKTLLLSPQS